MIDKIPTFTWTGLKVLSPLGKNGTESKDKSKVQYIAFLPSVDRSKLLNVNATSFALGWKAKILTKELLNTH